jgi:hypothetical protein
MSQNDHDLRGAFVCGDVHRCCDRVSGSWALNPEVISTFMLSVASFHSVKV